MRCIFASIKLPQLVSFFLNYSLPSPQPNSERFTSQLQTISKPQSLYQALWSFLLLSSADQFDKGCKKNNNPYRWWTSNSLFYLNKTRNQNLELDKLLAFIKNQVFKSSLQHGCHSAQQNCSNSRFLSNIEVQLDLRFLNAYCCKST